MKKTISTAARIRVAAIALFHCSFALSAGTPEPKKPSEIACNISAIERSGRIIRFILDDLTSTYKQDGGGGIGEIRQVATDVFRVSLLQEERIDHLTYHLGIDAKCSVKILRKEASATSFDRHQTSP